MKTRFLLCLVLSFTGLILIQSCGLHHQTPVIGLLMDQFNVERWSQDTTYFIKAVNELNGKVICKVANGDPQKQLDQAKELINKKVNVLVIVPADLNKAAEIVNMAHQASVPTISYDRLIQNSYLDYYISFDNVKVGELQADYIRKRLEKGNIALIGGPVSDPNSAYLRFGQLGILQPYLENGDIRIVYDKWVDAWSFEEGYKKAVECLNKNKVDAIIAGNDLLARGAIKALEEKGLAGKVLVAGQDADTEACENIIKGIQTVSIYKPIEDIAGNAAKLAVDLATGVPVINATITTNNGFRKVPSFLLTPTLVNKGNIGLQVKSGQEK
ncbi:MAG TPA: substrate-binding domain-containing protein [Bacteroidales bacterium]|jgi:D-xylose transport system substrate-binding protein|nr:substrate-binding domain-containing protein [Bacteroidales bacterium]